MAEQVRVTLYNDAGCHLRFHHPARWRGVLELAPPSAPRTPTRRATWPSSGWSSRRWRSATWTATWQLAEEFLKYIIAARARQLPAGPGVLQQAHRQHRAGDAGARRRQRRSSTSPTPRRSSILEKAGPATGSSRSTGASDLQSEHERYLTEEIFKKPVIVTDYPKEIKAFYMRANDDGKTVRAMDVLAPRIGEIIGGSQREERHDVLLEKIRDAGPAARRPTGGTSSCASTAPPRTPASAWASSA